MSKLNKTEETHRLYEDYIMHTYGSPETVFVRGAGVHLWDSMGRKYLDFSSGIAVCSLGHCHPDVTSAIVKQAQTLVHCSNVFRNENAPQLGRILIERSFGKGRCFFCNSGAEANEGMIKLARKWGNRTGRNEIIVMENSFHGRTLATLAATGRAKYREGFQPDMPGFKFVPFNDLSAAEKAVGPKTAAIMLEAVQGEGGILPADPEYLQGLRKLCDEKDLLLLCDEVQCGMFRTGTFCAWQQYGVKPDVFTLAKALANGVPIGAFVCGEKLEDVLQAGNHGTTFGGNPLACAAALAVQKTVDQDGIADNVVAMGGYLREKLERLPKEFDCVRGVRGRGLMLGVVLDFPASKILPLLLKKGLVALSAGETTLRLLPPLIVRKEDCDKAVRVIRAALKEYSKGE